MSEIKKKKKNNKIKIKSPPGPAEEGSSELFPKGKKLGTFTKLATGDRPKPDSPVCSFTTHWLSSYSETAISTYLGYCKFTDKQISILAFKEVEDSQEM